ncbi:MAG: hypothetical protein GY832_31680 [Chloroflexi bacterium]|nr:hypothetical protein [Chloroflexota bacterium]
MKYTQIPGCPRYHATPDGHIWRRHEESFRPLKTSPKGSIILSNRTNEPHAYQVSHLILRTFKDKWVGAGQGVRHLDGDRTNNSVDNLEIIVAKRPIPPVPTLSQEEEEALRELEGCHPYFANPNGDIYRWWANPGVYRPVKVSPDGYVAMHIQGSPLSRSVGALMLRTFIGEPGYKQHAYHINGDRGDNSLGNLRWSRDRLTRARRRPSYLSAPRHPDATQPIPPVPIVPAQTPQS